jgi:predicted RNA-binding protein with PUA-like domain
MRYWLMKSEPDEFSIDDLAAAKNKTTRGSACATTRRATSCATR